jgi:peptide-methionine (S)-S-oxide reductase
MLLGIVTVLGVAIAVSAGGQNAPDSAPAKGETPDGSTKSGGPAASGAAKTAKTPAKLEKATFASGCFWCGEAVFERIPGVKSVVSGYSGGHVPNPTYELVSTGTTGHAEAFQVEYDPSVVSYEKLLQLFWASHDPTTPNQQGPDFGPQYRSVIFYHNDAQKAAAQKSFQELTSKKKALSGLISTELVPMMAFYPAEDYHQDYYRRHRNDNPYCPMFITPKLKKLHLIK